MQESGIMKPGVRSLLCGRMAHPASFHHMSLNPTAIPKYGVPLSDWHREMEGVLTRLSGIHTHYLRKENELFPVLERHGIPVQRWDSPHLAHLESCSIQSVSSTTKEDKDFLQVEVTTSSDTMTIPAGSSVVLVQGPASNLIVAMLEPQSQWGLAPLPDFVELLEEGSVYPIRRILDYRY